MNIRNVEDERRLKTTENFLTFDYNAEIYQAPTSKFQIEQRFEWFDWKEKY